MSIYSTKEEFLTQGIVRVCPIPSDDPDCPICKEALESPFKRLLQMALTAGIRLVHLILDFIIDEDGQEEEEKKEMEDHSATKMPCCNNVFGHHCLTTWLSTANTCPFCRATFFPGPTPAAPPPLTDPEELRVQSLEARFEEIEDAEFFMEQWPAQREHIAAQWYE
jgi:hypothetical protein